MMMIPTSQNNNIVKSDLVRLFDATMIELASGTIYQVFHFISLDHPNAIPPKVVASFESQAPHSPPYSVGVLI